MENKTTIAKSATQYGLLLGVITIFEFVIGYILNIDPQTNKTFGIVMNIANLLILPFIFTYIACNHYKNKINEGFISFGQCLKTGVTIGLISSVVYGIFYFVFTLIFPEFVPELIEKIISITIKERPSITKEELDMSLSIMQKMMNPYVTIPLSIVMNCFIYLIHSLIVGAIVKKDANQSF